MGLNRVGIILMVAVFPMTTVRLAAQPAEPADQTALVVRAFNHAAVPADDLRFALTGAAKALSTAGVEISWLLCWDGNKAPEGAPAACRQPLPPGGHEVILRIQATSAGPGSGLVSMGFSLVGLKDSAPNLSTVYADQVASVAQRAGFDRRALLGLAIAHEIGHLLLDTNQHASEGLMRAVWSQSELRKNRPSDWLFQAAEARIMQSALSARTSMGN
jgi:hypothetical protein